MLIIMLTESLVSCELFSEYLKNIFEINSTKILRKEQKQRRNVSLQQTQLPRLRVFWFNWEKKSHSYGIQSVAMCWSLTLFSCREVREENLLSVFMFFIIGGLLLYILLHHC